MVAYADVFIDPMTFWFPFPALFHLTNSYLSFSYQSNVASSVKPLSFHQ